MPQRSCTGLNAPSESTCTVLFLQKQGVSSLQKHPAVTITG